MLDLTIRCDTCGRVPAALRLNGQTLCAGCAHAAIDLACPPAAPLRERSDEDTIRALRTQRTVSGIRIATRAPVAWVCESLRRLERAGVAVHNTNSLRWSLAPHML